MEPSQHSFPQTYLVLSMHKTPTPTRSGGAANVSVAVYTKKASDGWRNKGVIATEAGVRDKGFNADNRGGFGKSGW